MSDLCYCSKQKPFPTSTPKSQLSLVPRTYSVSQRVWMICVTEAKALPNLHPQVPPLPSPSDIQRQSECVNDLCYWSKSLSQLHPQVPPLPSPEVSTLGLIVMSPLWMCLNVWFDLQKIVTALDTLMFSVVAKAVTYYVRFHHLFQLRELSHLRCLLEFKSLTDIILSHCTLLCVPCLICTQYNCRQCSCFNTFQICFSVHNKQRKACLIYLGKEQL